MTRRASDSFDSRRASVEDRHHRKHRGKHGRNPCPCKPSAPTSAAITVLTDEQDRHARYRLKVTWDEVTTDLDGFPTRKIDRYVVHLQHSDDGSTWNSDYRRKVVDAKDADDNDTASAIFKGIRRRRYYRVRVRAVDKKGCKGPLSDWSSSTRVGTSDAPTGVGTITRTRVGPRRIEFDWADSTHPDFDRYKIVVLKADSSGGTYSTVGDPHYVRNSRYAIHVSDTDKTKWWKLRVRVQTTPDPAGVRAESGDDDSTPDQADDITGTGGGPTVAASTPTGVVTRRRLKAVLVRWDDVQDDTTQEPVKYRVYAASSSIADSPSFNPASVTKGGESLITRYWTGTAWADFTSASAGTTFYFRVQAKNSVGTSSLSSQVTGSPKKKLSTKSESDTFGTDDPDVTDVIANRFIADDGTGDRIEMADSSSNKAKLRFVGGGGNSTTFTVGNAGNIEVTGNAPTSGKVTFLGGLEAPSVALASAPSTSNGSIFVRSSGTNYANYLYWRSNGAWYRPSGIGNG